MLLDDEGELDFLVDWIISDDEGELDFLVDWIISLSELILTRVLVCQQSVFPLTFHLALRYPAL